jgi:ribulose-5-phosphate 4-epimerase/fuculose-1-phosphate aldolase
MNENLAREEICRIGKSLFERGYVHASAGNISVRLDDGFLITPTDACLGFLDPARLARLDRDGRQTGGDKGSKTIALHTRIYQATAGFVPAPRCVLHSHSTHCVALTLVPHGDELLAPITPYCVMKVGRVPVIPYHFPGDPRAAEQVTQVIARYAADGIALRAVMLERLGPTVWHETPAAAMATLEELEETARLMALQAVPPAPLTAAQLQDLRQQFGARW